MAIVHTQGSGNKKGDSVSILSHTFVGQPVVGSYIIVPFSRFVASSGTASVADNQGHTYTRAVQSPNQGSSNRAEVWYTKVATSSGSFQVDINPTAAGSYIDASFDEFSGLASSSVVDQTNSNSVSANTTLSTGNIITTVADELIIVVMNSGASVLFSFGGNDPSANSFTQTFSTLNGAVSEVGEGYYRIVSATGTYSGNWINAAPLDYNGAIVSFKAAGGGATPTNLRCPFIVG